MCFVNFRIKAVAERWRNIVMRVGNIRKKKRKIAIMYRKKEI